MRDYAELLSGYFDDNLTVAEAEALRDWLKASRANMRTFVRASVIHSRLRDVMMQHDMRSLVFEGAFGDTIDPDHIASLLDEEEATTSRRAIEAEEQARRESLAEARRAEQLDRKSLRIEEPRFPHVQVYAAVAAVAAVLLLAFNMFAPSASTPTTPPVAATPAIEQPAMIAEVVKTFGAELKRLDESLVSGAKLTAGLLSVERGVAELRFASGVTIIVEGPTQLEVLTPDRAKLVAGRVVVRVPKQALGFTLHSEVAAFVDLGTEFGVEVIDPLRANIHVLDGEVAFVPENGSAASRTLRRGFASEVAANGAVNDVKYDEHKFVRRVPNSAYELAIFKSRPLAYWRLDDVAPNAELVSEGKIGVPAIVGTGVVASDQRQRPANGNRPLRSARFAAQHGGIDVDADKALGMVSNCTYEAWVCPSGEIGPQRIFSTFDRPHAGMAFGVVDTAWYKLPESERRFHLTIYGRFDCMSTAKLAPNQWVHLAATVDADGSPTLYVNGEQVDCQFRPVVGPSKEPEKMLTDADVFLGNDAEEENEEQPRPWLDSQATPLGVKTVGKARIGRNPDGSDGKISAECWQGEISNVAVYDRVLSPAEIQVHMEATRDDSVQSVPKQSN